MNEGPYFYECSPELLGTSGQRLSMKKPLFLRALPLNPLAFLGAVSFHLTKRPGGRPSEAGMPGCWVSPQSWRSPPHVILNAGDLTRSWMKGFRGEGSSMGAHPFL